MCGAEAPPLKDQTGLGEIMYAMGLRSTRARRLSLAVILMLLLSMLAVLAGCGTEESTTLTTGATTSTAGATTSVTGATTTVSTEGPSPSSAWVLPELSILTGPGAPFGADAQWGALYAVKEINAAGGMAGRPIDMKSLDTAMDPGKAVTEMTNAVAMNPIAIIGPMDQISTTAAGQVAVDAGIPFFGSFNDAADLASYGGWGISLYPFIPDMAEAGIKLWVEANPDIKSVVIFTVPSDPALIGGSAAAAETFKTLGITVLGAIDTTAGQMDMSAPAIKAISLKPDGYYSVLNSEEQARLTVELRKRGVTEGRRVCAGAGANGATFYEVGGQALNDTFIWDVADINNTSERWQNLVAAYTADHAGALPYSLAITGQYNAVWALKTAIEAIGATGDSGKIAEERTKIKEYLLNATGIPGAQGPFDYVEGSFSGPCLLFQIKDAKPVLASSRK